MMEISFMTDDKNVAKALWALDGIAVGQPKIVPVRGAQIVKTKTGTRVKAVSGSMPLYQQVAEVIMKSGEPTVGYKYVKDTLGKFGGAVSGAGYLIDKLCVQGVLKKQDRGVYRVLKQL